MKRNQAATGIPALALLAVVGMATCLATSASAEETAAQQEARRVEDEVHRQQEEGRRQMEAQQRTQAEALQGQQDAIQKMDAIRERIEANTQQLAQQTADQVRLYSYPANISSTPLLPITPEVSAQVARARDDDPVSGISFAPLSERLGSYFGAHTGVLVVRAGAGAPFGLQDGDVILSIDGRVPADEAHVANILRSYRPGEHVKLRVQRDRKAINLDVMTPGPRGN